MRRVIVFTDSLDGIELLKKCPFYFADFGIYFLDLNFKFMVQVHFIPGHKIIIRIERADSAANAAHNLPIITNSSVSAH